MKENIGEKDKVIRIIILALLLIISYSLRDTLGGWQWILYIIAVILIITVLINKSLLYHFLKINTLQKESKEKQEVIKKPIKKRKR